MAQFKVVVSDPRSRKAYQKDVDQAVSGLLGKKLGDSLPAEGLGLQGYTLALTGGSDKDGFPMRRDVDGQGRKRILLSHGPGFHALRKGQKKRKSIRGNTISQDIVQINAKVLSAGAKTIEELWGVKPKEKSKEGKPEKTEQKGEKPAEKKHEEKAHPEKEEKAQEKKEEKHAQPHEKPEEKKDGAEQAEKKMDVKKLE